MERAAYLKEIVDAYQAEVWGEAIFSTLAEQATSEEEIEIWWTLPKGGGWANSAAGTARPRDSAATIKSMTEALPPFLTLHAQLQAEGPAEDRRELEFLNAHEIALQEFATRALAGGGRDSLASIRAFLSR